MKYARKIIASTFAATSLCIAISTQSSAQTVVRHEATAQATTPATASTSPAALPSVATSTTPVVPITPAIASVKVGILTTHAAPGSEGVQAMGEQVRSILARDISSPSIEPVLIFALTPDEVLAEAKQKNCAFLLESAIAEKKAGGMGMNKMMLLQSASMMMPMAGLARGVGGMVAAQAAGAAMSQASTLGMYVHPRSSYTFDYKLTPVGASAPVISNTETAKASHEGDDVLSPMLLHAATAITEQVKKK